MQNNNGWISLHRKLLKSPIIEDAKLLQVLIYCLLRANRKKNKVIIAGQEIKLKPGQFITGRHEASTKLKLKGIMFDRKIRCLKNVGFLNRQVNNKFSIITIINWKKYQIKPQKRTTKRTTNEQQMNTNNNTTTSFNYKSFKESNNNIFKDYLKSIYPEVDIEFHFKNMESWIRTNPKKGKKKNYAKFVRNWISREAKKIEQQKPKSMFPEFKREPVLEPQDNGLPKKKPTLTKAEEEQIHKERVALQKKIRNGQRRQNGKEKV